MNSSSVCERVPPGPLALDVEVVRITRSGSSPPFEVRTCPNGTPGLVFQRGAQGLPLTRIVTRSSVAHEVPEMFLHGQGLEPSVMSFSGHPGLVVQVVLKPQGLTSVFGIGGAELTLRSRLPGEFGAESLVTSLREASTDEALFQVIFGFLEARRSESGRRDPKVDEALRVVHSDPAIPSTALAAQLFLSVRQLQRRFHLVVGCSLKSYQRLRRAHGALSLVQQRRDRPLGEIAYELGYADQSHFIRDIKEFTWLVPGRLRGAWEIQSRDGAGFSFVEGS